MYITKLNVDCSINKYKARFVVKGYAQIPNVDYSDIFTTVVTTVAGLDTIRLFMG